MPAMTMASPRPRQNIAEVFPNTKRNCVSTPANKASRLKNPTAVKTEPGMLRKNPITCLNCLFMVCENGQMANF